MSVLSETVMSENRIVGIRNAIIILFIIMCQAPPPLPRFPAKFQTLHLVLYKLLFLYKMVRGCLTTRLHVS